ncbi:MAG: ABC-type transport auxiliary lipoprotein family protein [Micavibrio sp.]|nr:ABC-type transport auxiliary lipoprotein family protein [Micavibrio sp.]
MKNYRNLMTAVALAAFLPLAGCANALKSDLPAPTVYTLHASAQDGEAKAQPHKAKVLSIAEPAMPAGFDSNRIALYLDGGRRMDYYANAVWADVLSKVMQDVLLQSAADHTAFAAVPTDAGTMVSHRLLVKVLDFEPVYSGEAKDVPMLKVSINFRLVSVSNDKIILDTTVPLAEKATANTQTAIVTGLESLLQKSVDAAYDDVSARLAQHKKK